MSQSTDRKNVADYDVNLRAKGLHEGPLSWYSPKDNIFHVAGLAWFAAEHLYRRLSKNPPFPLPEAVDYLADSPTGGQIRFQTNSKQLAVRVYLSDRANMPHMTAVGQCGVDCYLGLPGQQRFISSAAYDHTKSEYECTLFDLTEAEMRNVTLNLPLYQGVEEILIGLETEAVILPPPPYVDDRSIVVYGTSIDQGGCASRPGMAYTNILSRKLNREFINLGFSGSGKGEPEVAHIIASIPNPSMIALDYEANCGADLIQQTLLDFIGILRGNHRLVPILVISATRWAEELFSEEAAKNRNNNRDFQINTVETLRRQGDQNIYFCNGAELLGEDFNECTVDGIHPTDLGFMRMADALEPLLRGILS